MFVCLFIVVLCFSQEFSSGSFLFLLLYVV